MRFLDLLSMIIAGLVIWLFLSLYPAHSQDTNPPEIQKWYRELTNRMGGSCCGEGDAYPAVIEHEATPNSYADDGIARITDPSSKEIVVKGVRIKVRPQLTGNLRIHFSWFKMTREAYGNPFDHAVVFVGSNMDGTISATWCVVPTPSMY